MKEKSWDDYNVIPQRPLDNGKFVADNAIWSEDE
jgi:hypothetical protein